MNVQPYFPEPVTVTGNVAAESYDARLRFVRWVVVFHALTLIPVAVVGLFGTRTEGPAGHLLTNWLPGPSWIIEPILLLLLLSVSRKLHGLTGSALVDRITVAVILPWVLYDLGWVIHELSRLGVAVWPLGVVAVSQAFYALLSGRDFSFVGQFALSALALAATVFGALVFDRMPGEPVALGAALALLWLGYHVYDLASLLQRRRMNERMLAAADLYRDVLNVLSYTVRVIQHWRKFRI